MIYEKRVFWRVSYKILMKFHTFIDVFRQNNVISDHCASIWDLHSIRLEISDFLRPLDSHLGQKWRFEDVFKLAIFIDKVRRIFSTLWCMTIKFQFDKYIIASVCQVLIFKPERMAG